MEGYVIMGTMGAAGAVLFWWNWRSFDRERADRVAAWVIVEAVVAAAFLFGSYAAIDAWGAAQISATGRR